jgi:GT2 family glycosyltransferase
MTIRVGVVIPVFNDWEGLQRCLRALAVQTYPSALVQVRVVDNGSSDWPAQPRFPLPVEVIRHDRPGSYGARNRAAAQWAVDLLAFTDADCEPAPDWLDQAVAAVFAEAASPRLVAGRIALQAASATHPSAGEQLDQILGFDQERTVRRAGFGVTANLFVAQSTFDALGGFRRHTRSGGDRDFCERALAQGHQLIYAPGALVRHPARLWPQLLAKQRRIVGGRLALAGPHPLARLQVLLLSLRPIVSESGRVIRRRQLGWPRRLQLLLLVLLLRLGVLLEWFRLQWPGQQALR